MGNFHTCGPNEVLVISGGWVMKKRKRYVIGGYAYAYWLVCDVQRLSLNLMTVYPYCVNVETSLGVAVTVSAVAQCKVMRETEFLKTAAEQLLGMDVDTIETNICQTIEGSLRAILGTLTVEEVYKDREVFSRMVLDVAAPTMARMGIRIVSFVIKDIWDSVDYLRSIGRSQIAAVKRDAAIGVANAERDAGIREAECEKQAQDVVFDMRARTEDHARMYNLAKSAFDQEVNAAKAEAALAYELQAAKVRQDIRAEEVNIDIVERKKTAEVEAKEVERKNKELAATVRLPAEAEAYGIRTVAEGRKTQTTEEGTAEAQRIKLLGKSEAQVTEEVGQAQAELMLQKARAFKKYGDAATVSLVLDALPNLTAQISAPLRNVNEILIMSGNDAITADVTRLLGQLPASVSAVAGGAIGKLWNKTNVPL